MSIKFSGSDIKDVYFGSNKIKSVHMKNADGTVSKLWPWYSSAEEIPINTSNFMTRVNTIIDITSGAINGYQTSTSSYYGQVVTSKRYTINPGDKIEFTFTQGINLIRTAAANSAWVACGLIDTYWVGSQAYMRGYTYALSTPSAGTAGTVSVSTPLTVIYTPNITSSISSYIGIMSATGQGASTGTLGFQCTRIRILRK